MRSAPKSRILMSDPELQARGSELSNTLQINVARYNKLKGFWFTFSELESKIFHKLAEYCGNMEGHLGVHLNYVSTSRILLLRIFGQKF